MGGIGRRGWTVGVALVALGAALGVGLVLHDHEASPAAARHVTTTVALPVGLKTPHELYGRWIPRSWTDQIGSHDVRPPAHRDISVAFKEAGPGPFIAYSPDCNAVTINTVTYEDGTITFDPASATSTLIGCGDTWTLPALQTLFGPNGHLRYQIAGNTLTVENLSARVTMVAVRAG